MLSPETPPKDFSRTFNDISFAPRKKSRSNLFQRSRNPFKNSIEFRSRMPKTSEVNEERKEMARRNMIERLKSTIEGPADQFMGRRGENILDLIHDSQTIIEETDDDVEKGEKYAMKNLDSFSESSIENQKYGKSKQEQINHKNKVLTAIKKAQASGSIRKRASRRSNTDLFQSGADEQGRNRDIVALRHIRKLKEDAESDLSYLVAQKRLQTSEGETDLVGQEILNCVATISEAFFEMKKRGRKAAMISIHMKRLIENALDKVYLVQTRYNDCKFSPFFLNICGKVGGEK